MNYLGVGFGLLENLILYCYSHMLVVKRSLVHWMLLDCITNILLEKYNIKAFLVHHLTY